MNQKYQKHFNIIVAVLMIVSVLITPFNVYATKVTPKATSTPKTTSTPKATPTPKAKIKDVREKELENIRKARESDRTEGVESGEKLEIEADVTTAAAIFANGPLTEAQIAEVIGKICQKDYKRSGILASVSAAQCILESGFLGTSLAMEANNCFGMKATLSGNTWPGTSWTGEIYTKQTWEEYSGNVVNIMADFRAYPSIEKSLADHSAYLLGAQNGQYMRYGGLQGETDYVKAIQIIKNGGYATDSRYVEKICSLIEKFDLTQYDIIVENQKPLELYRVRKSWDDVKSQLGAFADESNAKKACKRGYKVFDPQGKVVYEVK